MSVYVQVKLKNDEILGFEIQKRLNELMVRKACFSLEDHKSEVHLEEWP